MDLIGRGHLEVAVPVSSDRGALVSKALRDGLHDTPAPGLRSRARRCALGPQCDASLAVKGAVPNGRQPLRFKPAAPLTDLTTQLTGQGRARCRDQCASSTRASVVSGALLWTVFGRTPHLQHLLIAERAAPAFVRSREVLERLLLEKLVVTQDGAELARLVHSEAGKSKPDIGALV